MDQSTQIVTLEAPNITLFRFAYTFKTRIFFHLDMFSPSFHMRYSLLLEDVILRQNALPRVLFLCL